MARIVQKFGGTSLANIEKINNAARLVAQAVGDGHEVAQYWSPRCRVLQTNWPDGPRK